MQYSVKEIKAVGRYIKETDPGMVERLREDGDSVSMLSLGMYLMEVDREMFDHVLDFLVLEV